METSRFPSQQARLAAIRRVARDTFVYTLELAVPLRFAAGQFVNLAVPGAAPRGERSYSIYSSPAEDRAIELCVKLFPGGAASEYLRSRQEGDVVEIRGPFGVFTLRDGAEPVVFVATATGIAPFRSMLTDPARRGEERSYRLYFGVRSEEDLFAVDELEELSRTLHDFRYRLCLSRPSLAWPAPAHRTTDALASDFPAPTERFYLCGNTAMIEDARELLKSRSLDRKRIHVEKYY